MLLSFLLSILFYVVPIPLIAYMVFLWVKIPAPRPPRLAKKIITITVACLIIIHFALMLSVTEVAFERDLRHLRNGSYVNPALKDTIKLVEDSLFIKYDKNDSLRTLKAKYQLPGDDDPLLLREHPWRQMSINLAHYFRKAPINPDVSAEIGLDTAREKLLLHYRFMLSGDTIHMNAGRDTTQLLKYIKLSSTTHGQSATTK